MLVCTEPQEAIPIVNLYGTTRGNTDCLFVRNHTRQYRLLVCTGSHEAIPMVNMYGPQRRQYIVVVCTEPHVSIPIVSLYVQLCFKQYY